MAARGYLVAPIVFIALVWAIPSISRAGPIKSTTDKVGTAPVPTYTYLTQWGSTGSGDGQFLGPGPLAVAPDNKSVYVADTGNNRIEKFSASGTYVTQWGSAGSAPGQFSRITGLAVQSNGNVDVLDRDNQRIEEFSSSGTFLSQIDLTLPSDLVIDPIGLGLDGAGNRYVLGSLNGGLQGVATFNTTGEYVTDWGSDHLIYGNGSQPVSIAVSQDSLVYVANTYKGTRPGDDAAIVKFTSIGTFLTEWGGQGTADGQFTFQPGPLAVDNLGHVFAVDNGDLLTGDKSRIEMFDSSGSFITQWGSHGTGNGQFDQASGIATDKLGKVYISDRGNNRVEVFSSISPSTSTPTPTQSPTATPSVSPSPSATLSPVASATPSPTRTSTSVAVKLYLPFVANGSPASSDDKSR